MIKRLIDLIVALSLFFIFLIPFLVLWIVIRWNLGSPVLFCQLRPGLRGRPFMLVKFRTMTDQRAPDGHLLPDYQRLTPFGRFLRSTSLDELPELINVVRGEMSLVGPRPLLMSYLPLYTIEQMRRHDVLPGITGWAQVNGRNAISWDEKFKFDVWYVEHRTLCLDLKIIFRTITAVIRRDGITSQGSVTAEPFTGSNKANQIGAA